MDLSIRPEVANTRLAKYDGLSVINPIECYLPRRKMKHLEYYWPSNIHCCPYPVPLAFHPPVCLILYPVPPALISQAPRLGFFSVIQPQDLLAFEQRLKQCNTSRRQAQPEPTKTKPGAAARSSSATADRRSCQAESGGSLALREGKGARARGDFTKEGGPAGGQEDGYDSDGVKMVWASGTTHAIRKKG